MNTTTGIPVLPGKRFASQRREAANMDAFSALAEAIYNSIGSYFRMAKQRNDQPRGTIIIDHYKKDGERLAIHDAAEGMNSAEILLNVFGIDATLQQGTIGNAPVVEDSRSIFGTGLKDCAILGDVIVESIKNDRYSKITYHSNFEVCLPKQMIRDVNATPQCRKDMCLDKNSNGTTITIIFNRGRAFPRFKSLLELPWYFSLRHFMREDSTLTFWVREIKKDGELVQVDRFGNVASKETKQNEITDRRRIKYLPPGGEQVINEEFKIAGSKARLRVSRAKERLSRDSDQNFWHGGITIQSGYAIHELSYITDDIAQDPSSGFLFGELIFEDDPIDDLARRYNPDATTPNNNCLIIHPERPPNLVKKHSFVTEIKNVVAPYIRAWLDAERKAQLLEAPKVKSDSETTAFIRTMEKQCSKLLLGDEKDVEEGVPIEALSKAHLLFYHDTLRDRRVGEKANITLYAIASQLPSMNVPITITSDFPNEVGVLIPNPKFHESKRYNGVYLTSVPLEFLAETTAPQGALLEAKVPAIGRDLSAFAEIEVKNKTLKDALEFDKDEYRVKADENRILKIYAKIPTIIPEGASNVPIKVVSLKSHRVAMNGRCRLSPLPNNPKLAYGEVVVTGRETGTETVIEATIETAEGKTYTAKTTVHVTEKSEPKPKTISIRLVDHDLGCRRACWDRKDPDILEISLVYPSILPFKDKQKSSQFHSYIYDAITNAAAERKVLEELRLESDRWNDSPASLAQRVITKLDEMLLKCHTEHQKINGCVKYLRVEE